MEILTSAKRLYIRFKSLVNYFVYSFGRAALLLLVEVQNHTFPVRERGRIRVIVFLTSTVAVTAKLVRLPIRTDRCCYLEERYERSADINADILPTGVYCYKIELIFLSVTKTTEQQTLQLKSTFQFAVQNGNTDIRDLI